MASKSDPKICVELLPINDQTTLPPGNLVAPSQGSGPLELALDVRYFWRNGTTLRVRFLGGSQFVQSKVKQYAKTWESYANIKFQFVNTDDAVIRVNFQQGAGSWSYIGSSNLQIPRDQPTMNFGWFNDATRDEEFSRTVIHEFGHALGCIHEHMSPAANIPWDKAAVYKYFMGPPNNWTKEQIDRNLFDKYAPSAARYTRFDPWSIMCYAISDDFTIGTWSTPSNTVLSRTDKSFIRQMYPPRTHSEGVFRTMDLHPWNDPKPQNSKQFSFDPPYENDPPRIAIGLTELDVSKDANIRVNAYADRVTKEDLVVHTDAWADTTLYSAGATWMEAGDIDSDFQTGEFNTLELHPWNEPTPQNSKRVNFARSFPEPPCVIVWLKGVDMDKNHNWRVTAHASDISAEGFAIHIDTWADTTLYSGAASWIAYPASKKDACSGFADTSMQKETGLEAQAEKGGRVVFPEGMFEKEPTVRLAIKSFDFDHEHNLRFRADVKDVSKEGFQWTVSSWADSVCYGAGISYLAF
ncbi:hypothetical protein LTR66_002720 [Elasticomyces elasticus]|nr:hypothetical protein LTR50_005455 [Elasticomyces elasticus]KAK4997974.1 hypothetical protein LTR66_002720 [Elasticomyces elasticus]